MDIKNIIANNPLIRDMVDKKEVVWINPKEVNYSEYEKKLPINDEELIHIRALLITKDAKKFYEKFGFYDREDVMQKDKK